MTKYNKDDFLQVLRNPAKIVKHLGGKGWFHWMPDEMYIKICYRAAFGRKLDLQNPRTFNEKLQWLKLHDRRPEYTIMVDKLEVKKYVADKIGDEYIIPTLGVWDKFDDIDFSKLPDQFVLKCTHDSGGLVICRDKSKLDLKAAKKKINKSLRRNFFWVGREWPYKDVKPRIIAEKYLEDISTKELRDYKFFCFGGIARCFKVDYDRFTEHHANYFDEDGNLLECGEAICPPKKGSTIILPEQIPLMKILAENLANEQVPFLRTDFYDANGSVYFGEMTLYPSAGFEKFIDEATDAEFGKWLDLPSMGGCILISENVVAIFIEAREVIRNLNGLIEDERVDSVMNVIRDYKVFCFNGKSRMTLVCSDRNTENGLKEDFYDESWTHLDIKRVGHENSEKSISCPINYDRMKEIAACLSKQLSFARIDFYELNQALYFGEITLYPADGFEPFQPESWDMKMGEWLKLSGGGIC